ncbi:MAG: penicillin acylase family protein, partial [Candidatus Eremiobacteraeota bacterium]|nr:penicillin acylase family protein [Candidatus Eremiobacteraeota bacterium]
MIALRRVVAVALLALACVLAVALAFGAYVVAGVRAGAHEPTGRVALAGLDAPVAIAYDARGIPHVRAATERDALFAEGYLQGSERLFQIDVYRRAIEGTLAEVFGSGALAHDESARVYDIAGIVHDEFERMSPASRRDVDAFDAGVNAAIATRPLPPEFRLLAYRPRAWTADDSLAEGFATVIDLTDGWEDIATRAAVLASAGPEAANAFFPITDPAYDTPAGGGKPAPTAPLPPLRLLAKPARSLSATSGDAPGDDAVAGLGSNDFVAGSALTATHRALLANDPHLSLRMPGIWYLVDLEAPGLHVAGATLAGVPGVILGHDEHLAWGATNGT